MGSVLLVTLATYPMCEYSVVGRFIGVVRRRMRSVGLFPQLAIKGSKELGMTAPPPQNLFRRHPNDFVKK